MKPADSDHSDNCRCGKSAHSDRGTNSVAGCGTCWWLLAPGYSLMFRAPARFVGEGTAWALRGNLSLFGVFAVRLLPPV